MTEETLGRRIAANRKRLGLTQDALAEQLGVTAQAVSKWENDQSCPDISMLPRLAQIFAVTTDELLGMEKKAEEELPQLPAQETAPESMKVSAVSRTGIGMALWLLLTGLVLALVELFPDTLSGISFWVAAGLTGLTVFGLMGLYPRFSLFRLGCGLTGIYCLYCDVFRPDLQFHTTQVLPRLLPFLLMIFGAGLLLDCFLGKKTPVGWLSVNGVGENLFEYEGNTFRCTTRFGEDHRIIRLPQLDGGRAEVAFGELSVDLHECEQFCPGCRIKLKCSFGELQLYVPAHVRLECTNRSAFGAVQEYGRCGPEAKAVIHVENNVSFGQISIKYI